MESFMTNTAFIKVAIISTAMLGLFLLASAVSEMKSWKFIGSGTTATNTITVSGTGEGFAVADIATFTVTVTKDAKDVKSAQKQMTDKMNEIIAYVKKEGKVEDRDLKTVTYNVGPKYEWIQPVCVPNGICNGGENKLVGYEATQSILVKVRNDIDAAGDIIAAAGTMGATNISSLEFTVDDEDKVKDDARKDAIAKAKAKAEALASSLGVTIVRVVGFSEDGGAQPMYMKAERMMNTMSADMASAPSPTLPVGENKMTSTVNITYEIR